MVGKSKWFLGDGLGVSYFQKIITRFYLSYGFANLNFERLNLVCSWIDETFLVELFCHMFEVHFSLKVSCI